MSVGRVIFAGAGCGPDLITVAGLNCVRRAETIVYDDLIDPKLVEEVPDSCRRIYVGKRSGRHSMRQEQINEVLIREASEGRLVVRLKGGDSFVFGRGGEEILALRDAGIPWEVIPGVTSAVAVPEFLGIPVTHRGVARSFAVITGHTREESDTSDDRWRTYARMDGTLVFLMGLGAAEKIGSRLIAEGMNPGTPAAILSRGFAPDAARIDGTLGELGAMAHRARTPAIIVVGETAGFHLEPAALTASENGADSASRVSGDSKAQLPSVTVIGTPFFTGRMRAALAAQGYRAEIVPCVKIVPAPEAIPEDLFCRRKAHCPVWLVFTSSNGVRIFFDALRARNADLRILGGLKFACIGAGTRRTLLDCGIHADFVPSQFTAEALGQELGAYLASGAGREEGGRPDKQPRVVILRAANGSPDLTRALDGCGIHYEDCRIYETATDADVIPDHPIGTDWVIFASAMGARGFFEAGGDPGDGRILCIGPVTEREVRNQMRMNPGEDRFREAGRLCTAHEHSAEGITRVLKEI